MSINVGDEVLFGKANGVKTRGRVVKINASSVKVAQLEERGGRPVGTEWRVAPSLVYPLEGRSALAALAPLVSIPPLAGVRAPAFRVGQRVAFTAKGRTITGTVVRVNSKSVTVDDCDDGSRGWRVAPSLLAAVHAPARP